MSRLPRIKELEARTRVAEEARNKAEIGTMRQTALASQFRSVAKEAMDLMKLLIRATDVRPLPGIYFLLAEDDTVLYVGKSGNVLFRLAGHKEKNFADVRMIHVPKEAERDRLEGRFIHVLTPVLNVSLTAFNKTQALMESTAQDFPQHPVPLSEEGRWELRS